MLSEFEVRKIKSAKEVLSHDLDTAMQSYETKIRQQKERAQKSSLLQRIKDFFSGIL